ncbi:MAG: hypothetical protein ACRC62_06155 [Microcoleus sp.]
MIVDSWQLSVDRLLTLTVFQLLICLDPIRAGFRVERQSTIVADRGIFVKLKGDRTRFGG